MIDFTDRYTLMTIKTALCRALNSLDNEIGDMNRQRDRFPRHHNERIENKRQLLEKSRDDMRRIFDAINL